MLESGVSVSHPQLTFRQDFLNDAQNETPLKASNLSRPSEHQQNQRLSATTQAIVHGGECKQLWFHLLGQ
eukprot:6474342-Amphidinium_carterae.1